MIVFPLIAATFHRVWDYLRYAREQPAPAMVLLAAIFLIVCLTTAALIDLILPPARVYAACRNALRRNRRDRRPADAGDGVARLP